MSRRLTAARVEALIKAAYRGLDEYEADMEDQLHDDDEYDRFRRDTLAATEILHRRYVKK